MTCGIVHSHTHITKHLQSGFVNPFAILGFEDHAISFSSHDSQPVRWNRG
jgi:hypothetical protein